MINNNLKEEPVINNNLEESTIENNSLKEQSTTNNTLKESTTFIETPKWIYNQKCSTNPQNYKDNKCFQYALLFLFYKEIKYHPQSISKLKPFMDNLNWDNINFPPQEQDYQQFEMSNKSIALNILQVQDQEKNKSLQV